MLADSNLRILFAEIGIFRLEWPCVPRLLQQSRFEENAIKCEVDRDDRPRPIQRPMRGGESINSFPPLFGNALLCGKTDGSLKRNGCPILSVKTVNYKGKSS